MSPTTKGKRALPRDAAKATIARCDADVVAGEAALAKAKVDVRAARAELEVSQSKSTRLEERTGHFAPRTSPKSDFLGDVDAARAPRGGASDSVRLRYRRHALDAELKRLRHVIDLHGPAKPVGKPKAKSGARERARAAIEKAEADVISYRAALSKAKVEASVASATLAVAQSATASKQLGAGDFTLVRLTMASSFSAMLTFLTSSSLRAANTWWPGSTWSGCLSTSPRGMPASSAQVRRQVSS